MPIAEFKSNTGSSAFYYGNEFLNGLLDELDQDVFVESLDEEVIRDYDESTNKTGEFVPDPNEEYKKFDLSRFKRKIS